MSQGATLSYTYPFTIARSGDMTIPVDIYERHFVEDDLPDEAVVQAVGTFLQITVWSERDSIQIDLPTSQWYAEKPMTRSLSGMRINLARWTEHLDARRDGDAAKIKGNVHVIENNWRPKDLSHL